MRLDLPTPPASSPRGAAPFGPSTLPWLARLGGVLAIAWSLGAPVAVAADPVNPFREPDESDLFRLDEQLVTVASRYAQTARKAPSIVNVVTADEIRDHGYRTVSDVLRTLPGIYIWKNTEGRDLAAFRGVISSDNNKILIMIDGQPWYDGVYTHAFIDEYLPVSHIQQIEVIKGPGSAIYGTNAFAGVINIVTWEASRLEGGRFRWMVGGIGRSDVTAMGGGRTEVAGRTASMTAYARHLGQIGAGLDVTPSGDRDIRGTDPRGSLALGARLQYQGLSLQVHHVDYQHTYLSQEVADPMHTLSKTLDAFAVNYHNTFMDARWAIKASDNVTFTPYYWSQHYRNPGGYFYDTGIQVTEPEPGIYEAINGTVTVETEKTTRRWGTGLDFQARPGVDHVLVAGAGIENVAVRALFDAAFDYGTGVGELTGFQVDDACGQAVGWFDNPRSDCRGPALRNLFGYTQYTWTALPSLEFTGGLRVDKRIPVNDGEEPDDGVFVLSVSPRAGLLLVPSDRVSAKLLYGRAFRAPNVREILVRSEPQDDGSYQFSNGNLETLPETINTIEGEVTARVTDELEVRLDGSWSIVNNEVEKVNPPNQYCNLPTNLQIVGAEAGFKATPGSLRLGGSYAMTLARYTGDDPFDPDLCPGVGNIDSFTGLRQYEFPPHMLKGNVGWSITEQLSATLLAEWYSARPREAWAVGDIEDGDPFFLLHGAARLARIGPQQRLDLGVSIRNLLDTQWETGNYRNEVAEGVDGAARYPYTFRGEPRSAHVWIELRL